MSTEVEPDPKLVADLNDMVQHLEDATKLIVREHEHMLRHRRFVAWGALALAAVSCAALLAAETVQAAVFGVAQLALWGFVAGLNFGGPKVSEWLARHGKP
jgi:hypothetical protein